MKKIVTAAMTLVCLGIAFGIFGTSANAATSTMMDYNHFDYEKYAEDYPDLAAVYGDNKDALYAHYVERGENENRKAYLDKKTFLTVSNFDAFRYASDYPDLSAALGTDQATLFNHYYTLGYQENRSAHSTDEDAEAAIEACDIATEITNDDMGDYDKAKAIHDWLCKNVMFDYNNYMGWTIPEISRSYTGAIINRVAISDGYAEAFDLLARASGLDSRVISGTALYATGYSEHEWNQVRVDGSWYSVDVTLDDTIPDQPGEVSSYQYFMISIQDMAKNHKTS